MQKSTKRRVVMRSAVVVIGSARRTTMKMDEARGGIKVFNGKESHKNDSNADQGGERGCRRLRRNQSDSVTPCTPSKENALIERSAVKVRKASSDLSNSPTTSTKQEQVLLLGDGNKGDGGEGKMEEEVEIEREEGDKSFVDKKMDQPEEQPMSVREQEEEEEDEEDEVNYENQDIPVPSQDAEKDQLPVSVSSMNVVESKQNPVTEHKAMNPDPAVLPHPEAAEDIFGSNSAKNNRMQSIANLVMWRDVSKSAFVFGSGTFFLVSSSYTNDINFSLISASSYVGLFYLGFAFLCKSILRRGETMECDERDERYMVGEEEAIWLLKLLLPYVNELLLKLRSLFSGDPATTLKLAVLLFVMARCGSSITIWSLAKLSKIRHGRQNVLWSLHHPKDLLLLLHSAGKIWQVLVGAARRWMGVMHPQESSGHCNLRPRLEHLLHGCSHLGIFHGGGGCEALPAMRSRAQVVWAGRGGTRRRCGRTKPGTWITPTQR
ncbi:reticulon-like protein B21 isoform X2 [Musa acuminata AAA Group]|uniref:reticulon-like protein B21 isoform X2 n=1 Tax=Musa acuminata AAA Group TaxID=214697 RepID=UPI0031D7B5C2